MKNKDTTVGGGLRTARIPTHSIQHTVHFRGSFSIKNFCNLIFSSWLFHFTLVWGQSFIHKQWSISFEWLGSLKTFFDRFIFWLKTVFDKLIWKNLKEKWSGWQTIFAKGLQLSPYLISFQFVFVLTLNYLHESVNR